MAVFISYSSQDRPSLKALQAALRRAEQKVWFDEELGGGDAWWNKSCSTTATRMCSSSRYRITGCSPSPVRPNCVTRSAATANPAHPGGAGRQCAGQSRRLSADHRLPGADG